MKHAIAKGVRIIVLYPEDGRSDITKKDITNLVSNIEKDVHLNGISSAIDSVMIIDNAKILLIVDEIKNVTSDNNIIGIFSTNSSLVKNFGSLFDILDNEKEVLKYIVKTKNQLESSNKQLKESNQKSEIFIEAQKEFINIVAHDLRTPLTPIIGLTEYVRDKTKDVHHMELLDRVVKDAKKLSYLNEKILDVTKFESKLFKPNKEVFSLNELIVNIIKELEHISDNTKKIKFEYHFDTEYLVDADSRRISQVISNLIDNSIKSISEQEIGRGVISISIEKTINAVTTTTIRDDEYDSQHMVIVSIKDTGIALDNEILPRLFTKFATKSFQGTGLGLYISKNIIEAHGGKIWAENNTNKKGAMFKFTLPAV